MTLLTKPARLLCAARAAALLARTFSSAGPTNTLIIGAPGSGKGTISNWIVRDFGLKHVSPG